MYKQLVLYDGFMYNLQLRALELQKRMKSHKHYFIIGVELIARFAIKNKYLITVRPRFCNFFINGKMGSPLPKRNILLQIAENWTAAIQKITFSNV